MSPSRRGGRRNSGPNGNDGETPRHCHWGPIQPNSGPDMRGIAGFHQVGWFGPGGKSHIRQPILVSPN